MLHFGFCFLQHIYHVPLTRHKSNSSCKGLWYAVKTKHHEAKRKHQNCENPKAFINLLTAGTLEEWTGRDLYVDWLIMQPKDMLTKRIDSTVGNYELSVPQNYNKYTINRDILSGSKKCNCSTSFWSDSGDFRSFCVFSGFITGGLFAIICRHSTKSISLTT